MMMLRCVEQKAHWGFNPVAGDIAWQEIGAVSEHQILCWLELASPVASRCRPASGRAPARRGTTLGYASIAAATWQRRRSPAAAGARRCSARARARHAAPRRRSARASAQGPVRAPARGRERPTALEAAWGTVQASRAEPPPSRSRLRRICPQAHHSRRL
eukprot:2452289-Pleurochrysis_carterae.AAC.1